MNTGEGGEHKHGGVDEGRDESMQVSLHSFFSIPGVNITFNEIGRNLNWRLAVDTNNKRASLFFGNFPRVVGARCLGCICHTSRRKRVGGGSPLCLFNCHSELPTLPYRSGSQVPIYEENGFQARTGWTGLDVCIRVDLTGTGCEAD